VKRTELVPLSLLCYLIPVVGPIVMLTLSRDSRVARSHGQQVLAMEVSLVGLFAVWGMVAWLLAWIPTIGPMTAAMLFAVVIAGIFGLAVLWAVGLVQALRGKEIHLPIVSNVSHRIFGA